MKKTTKKDRVEQYLEELMKSDGFTVESLMNLTVYDLFGNAELEGIGKTTLSGALNSFKKKHGLKKAGKGGIIMHKNTKKERVERYLANLMKSDDFSVHDLMNLTVYDLFGNAELEGIGKTTLSSGISAFKKKYLKIQYDDKAAEANNTIVDGIEEGVVDVDVEVKVTADAEIDMEEKMKIEVEEIEEGEIEEGDEEQQTEEPIDDQESFEDVLLSAIEKNDMTEEQLSPSTTSATGKQSIIDQLSEGEVNVLKSMIYQFKNGQMGSDNSRANLELTELKHALKHFGIEYKTILDQYRRNVEN